MSIELEWSKLDASLAAHVVQILNAQLASAERPSFIGPVEVLSLDFGTVAPDIELVDMRDIYRDFLDDNSDDDGECGGRPRTADGDDDGYEWVSRRTAGREEGRGYEHLPPHVRYGRGGPLDTFPSVSADGYSPSPPAWMAGSTEPWQAHTPWQGGIHHCSPSPSTPFSPSPPAHSTPSPVAHVSPAHADQASLTQSDTPPFPSSSLHPNLQLHLHVNWHSTMRVTLATSLQINYPSHMFMALPIKLSVTGLVFNGELAVAYEGERRRVHICILDDHDPYGPAGDRPKRNDSTSNTYLELDEELSSSDAPHRSAKPLPVGQRLLPSIYIESEIGQRDKHVLKNVTRVERFIQDIIRKSVEEELVFPNFHTLLLGDS